MLKKTFILCSIAFLMIGCSPTFEARQAQKRISERYVLPTKHSGGLYRYPPTENPIAPQPPELPEGMTVAYSPLTGETTLVPLRRARRMMPAKTRKESSKEMVASYSPLTGEAVWVPKATH